jgi:hypothetical protein
MYHLPLVFGQTSVSSDALQQLYQSVKATWLVLKGDATQTDLRQVQRAPQNLEALFERERLGSRLCMSPTQKVRSWEAAASAFSACDSGENIGKSS